MIVVGSCAGLALAAWLYLLLAHGGYWRLRAELPEGADPARWPSVVAVVPARDEATVLPATLPGLLGQDYPGSFEIVLVDDASTDGTGDLAGKLAADDADDADGVPLRVVTGTGVRQAGQPDYLLFTDADIHHPADSVTRLVRAAEAGRRDLVSLMARLRTDTYWERAVVPAFVYFFAQLYPFDRANRPRSRTAAAAGGCVLLRRDVLAAAGGLERIRGALIDDVALATLIKRAGRGRIWLGLSTRVRSLRGYPGLADLWDMVARSAYTQLRHSVTLLTGTVAGLLLLYAAPPVATLTGLAALATEAPGAGAVAALGAAGWLIMAGSYLPMLRRYHLTPGWAPLLPAVALLYAGMTLDSAWRHARGRGGAWKGRTGP